MNFFRGYREYYEVKLHFFIKTKKIEVRFVDFSTTMSRPRMSRHLAACGGNTRKAMTLYRLNLRLSQELFTVISCFEVALRNRICRHYTAIYGDDWLRNFAQPGGVFDTARCSITRRIINEAVINLLANRRYSHDKLMAEMEFGFWRYLFAQPQFYEAGQTLLQIFPGKTRSTPSMNYNHTYIFNQLGLINNIRNRIAHHEPVCFASGIPIKDTTYCREHYAIILQLFQWMHIDESSFLYGLDHINTVCCLIDSI
jgi:Abi-like protein.